jgi:hypothetical protein
LISTKTLHSPETEDGMSIWETNSAVIIKIRAGEHPFIFLQETPLDCGSEPLFWKGIYLPESNFQNWSHFPRGRLIQGKPPSINRLSRRDHQLFTFADLFGNPNPDQAAATAWFWLHLEQRRCSQSQKRLILDAAGPTRRRTFLHNRIFEWSAWTTGWK